MKKLTWTIVIIFLLLAGPVTAHYYRYIDKGGHLRFTDDLTKVPAEQRIIIRENHKDEPCTINPVNTPPLQKIWRKALRGVLLVRGLPEFAEHVLAGPEEVLGVEEDLDADAGRPFGVVGAVVDRGEAAGSEIRGDQLPAARYGVISFMPWSWRLNPSLLSVSESYSPLASAAAAGVKPAVSPSKRG